MKIALSKEQLRRIYMMVLGCVMGFNIYHLVLIIGQDAFATVPTSQSYFFISGYIFAFMNFAYLRGVGCDFIIKRASWKKGFMSIKVKGFNFVKRN